MEWSEIVCYRIPTEKQLFPILNHTSHITFYNAIGTAQLRGQYRLYLQNTRAFIFLTPGIFHQK